MESYRRIFAKLREKVEDDPFYNYENEVELAFQIISAFEAISTYAVGIQLKNDIVDAFAEIQDAVNKEVTLATGREQSIFEDSADDIVEIRELPINRPILVIEDDSEQSTCGDDGNEGTLAIDREQNILEESDDDIFQIRELPMNRQLQGIEKNGKQSTDEDDGNDIIAMHEQPSKRRRKRDEKQNKRQHINMGWIKDRLSRHAYDNFHFFFGDEDELRRVVKERFTLILQASNSLENRDVANIVDLQGIPIDLQDAIVCYLDATTKKTTENFRAYSIAKTIADKVDNANSGFDTLESKRKQIKHIYAILRKSFKTPGEGTNFGLHCKKCKILADRVGLFALVIPEVFSKDFILKNVNEENVENIYNVAESQLADKLMDAAIVDGIYVIEGEE